MPVDDPAPVVVPEEELAVVVLDEPDEAGLVEPVDVLDVEPVGVSVEFVEEVPVPVPAPVEPEVDVDVDESVGDVEEPSGVVEVLTPSAGALGLAPPPLRAVEMPPVARTLTLVVVVVEIVVDACAAGLLAVGAALPALASPTEGRVGATNIGWDSAGVAAPGSALATESTLGVTGCAGATAAACARWWCWGTGVGSVCWSSTAPPAVTTAAASSVATWPAPALSVPTPTAVEVPAAPPAARAPPAAPPPAPPRPSTLASTPSGPSVGTIAPNRRLTPRS